MKAGDSALGHYGHECHVRLQSLGPQDDIVADVTKVSTAALEKKARRRMVGNALGMLLKLDARLLQGTGALLLAHDVLGQDLGCAVKGVAREPHKISQAMQSESYARHGVRLLAVIKALRKCRSLSMRGLDDSFAEARSVQLLPTLTTCRQMAKKNRGAVKARL
eukprot:Skav211893  [mRNA]  locus=scaffold2021:6732:8308:+ [translate_table: standard]